LFVDAPRISRAPLGARVVSLRRARSSRWRPVSVSLARRSATVPSKQISPPFVARAGAEVDDVVRDGDGLRLVLHHEHGVALVPQLDTNSVFMRSMSWGCRPMVGSSNT
jgi:hypothetical protein